MLINEVILTETFENLLPGDEKKKAHYAEEIYAMLNRAYASMGGIMGSGFNDPQDMLNIPMWKIFRRGTDIKAVAMYKDKGGRKRVAVCTDGSDEGRKWLGQIMKDDVLLGRAFAEISDKSLGFHKKILGQDVLDSISVPVEQVIAYFKPMGQEITPVDNYEYTRILHAGKPKQKLMIGTLGNEIK